MGMLANRFLSNQLPGGKQQSEKVVDNAYRFFLLTGLLLPLAKAGKRERVCALRTLEVLLLSQGSVNGLKRLIPSQRPDSLQQNSFPSKHATNAVVVATVASRFYKKQAAFWYGGAALIGLSRLLLRRHRGRDVLAGSLLGYGLARWELSRRRGLLVPPLARQMKAWTEADAPQNAGKR